MPGIHMPRICLRLFHRRPAAPLSPDTRSPANIQAQGQPGLVTPLVPLANSPTTPSTRTAANESPASRLSADSLASSNQAKPDHLARWPSSTAVARNNQDPPSHQAQPIPTIVSTPSTATKNNHAGSAGGGTANSTASSRTNTARSTASSLSAPSHKRQHTNLSLNSLRVFDLRYEARHKRNRRKLHEQFVSTYCLAWEDLRDWLLTRFEGTEFDEEASIVPDTENDLYRIWTPETLTRADRNAIYKLRSDYDSDKDG